MPTTAKPTMGTPTPHASTIDRPAIDGALRAALLGCARKGVQLTDLRREVLRLILTAEGPSTAYQLLARLKETRASATPPTIYRVLNFLLEQHLIHRVERLNAFVPCVEGGRQHDHAAQFLICRRCGTVSEIEDSNVTRALEHAAGANGFHPDRAVVEVDGTCAACFQTA